MSFEHDSDAKACLKMDRTFASYPNFMDNSAASQPSQLAAAPSSTEWAFPNWNRSSTGAFEPVYNGSSAQLMLNDPFAIPHLYSDAGNSKMTPSPSEASSHHAPLLSGVDLQQKLLNAQLKPGSFENYHVHPHWSVSFPPAAYHIIPPCTPEDPVVSPMTLFREVPRPSSIGNDMGQQDFSCSINNVRPPCVDNHYLSHADSEHQDQSAAEDQRSKEAPYAELLYKCLLSAPDHQMVLKDIYEWFRANTQKTNNPDQRGWMNSIRHNLSMNQAFEKVEHSCVEDGRRGYKWRLSETAKREGVQSTTRYRKKAMSGRSSLPKSRRHSYLGANKISRINLQRPTQIQTNVLDEEVLDRHHLDHNARDEQKNSPRSYIAATASTPRGFALPSGMDSPIMNSMQSSPDRICHEAFSPFVPRGSIPRSDPTGNSMKFLNNPVQCVAPQDPIDFQSVYDRPLSMFWPSNGNDQWEEYHQEVDNLKSASDSSALDQDMFSISMEHCFAPVCTEEGTFSFPAES